MQLQYRTVDGVVGDRLDEFFKRKNTFVEVSPGDVIMPRKFVEIGQQIRDGAVRPSDVWLISYPRAGERESIINHFITPVVKFYTSRSLVLLILFIFF